MEGYVLNLPWGTFPGHCDTHTRLMGLFADAKGTVYSPLPEEVHLPVAGLTLIGLLTLWCTVVLPSINEDQVVLNFSRFFASLPLPYPTEAAQALTVCQTWGRGPWNGVEERAIAQERNLHIIRAPLQSDCIMVLYQLKPLCLISWFNYVLVNWKIHGTSYEG